MDIPRFVLTGGPCGGKTSALAYLTEKLADKGYYVLHSPEAATLLIQSGMNPHHFDKHFFQSQILDLSIELENRIMEIAEALPKDLKPIVLADRGAMEGKVYGSDQMFREMLADRGLKEIEVREKRYEGVFHMVSAACGAEEYYTTANNTVRREDVAEARKIDAATQRAWLGHPKLVIVGNTDHEGKVISFEQKLHRLAKAIFKQLGIPEPLEIERKFLVDFMPDAAAGCIVLNGVAVHVEQFYLRPEDGYEEVRFRKRSQFDGAVYFETRKRMLRPGVRVETERLAKGSEYEFARRFQKTGSRVIRKQRVCFLHNGRQYELDIFDEPHEGMQILEVELQSEDEKPDIPPYINILKEVTNDPAYSNAAIANAL